MNEAQKVPQLEKRQAFIEASVIDPEDETPAIGLGGEESKPNDDEGANGVGGSDPTKTAAGASSRSGGVDNLSADLLKIPGMKVALIKKVGFDIQDTSAASGTGDHYMEEIEINDYPKEARWKVTQKETPSRLQDEFQITVTLKN